jgi:hypothetical protein
MKEIEQETWCESHSAEREPSSKALRSPVSINLPADSTLGPPQPRREPESDGRDGVSGEFVDFAGERFYAIHNVNRMAPFFVSVISSSDHWLFVSSTGGLTAGRVSPESALFPYIPVDKVHESAAHTGSTTLVRVKHSDRSEIWEPFAGQENDRHKFTRNLYKNFLGNRLCFEEVNHDLKLAFRYTWSTSDQYGFVRQCRLENLSDDEQTVDLLDGLRNILPSGAPSFTQATASNLVDAYKWTELETESGLALYALYSGISDRAEPAECLRANIVFSLGVESGQHLISSEQIADFRTGKPLRAEVRKRGVRGDYFVATQMRLPQQSSRQWMVVANVDQTQSQIVKLQRELADTPALMRHISESVDQGSDELARIIAAADGFQEAAEERVTAHHYANVLFNVLRGGVFDDQYTISADDFRRHIATFNRDVYARNSGWLEALPEKLELRELLRLVASRNELQLERLCYEYLPITFGRRHGDPSRPWNKFSIRLKDDRGRPLLFYEGNWRDIFQNWEALVLSFPEFIESVIARFVNASTVDGYNPYRITKDGIDWEVEDLRDPWSYIGYWGDHQIIYLLKLLELSTQFHPGRLSELLRHRIFSYANVPYRIRSFNALLRNPKVTVDFDRELNQRIVERADGLGADGRLVTDATGDVHLVNLLEKLLVPLLAKIGNLVVDGGVWMNTQRPEWNDANNALVGNGLSMVTLCYMRRYVAFFQDLLDEESEDVRLSAEVSRWLSDTMLALNDIRSALGRRPLDDRQRFVALEQLGLAASRYRKSAYADHPFKETVAHPIGDIRSMLAAVLIVIDRSISSNKREDGLYHAYNLMDLEGDSEVAVEHLYPMLEGQVAALSSGAMGAAEAISLIEALCDSELYRPDQRSFMLYPDRELPGFLEKNQVPSDAVDAVPLLRKLLQNGDERILAQDAAGTVRFNADISNAGALNARLDLMTPEYGEELEAARRPIRDLYESVFRHRAFTGRSGGMFGFEGLGCIYWHMVSKLLLAVQENFFSAVAEEDIHPDNCRRLGELYYRIRDGLGFNKTPAEYGAFPIDPYSHTPGHSGARQPGMTGQVKEGVLARFGELGVRIVDGRVRFEPMLLREQEFLEAPSQFRFLDVDDEWINLAVPGQALAFTWCQVPIIYRLVDSPVAMINVIFDDGRNIVLDELCLSQELSAELFDRNGHVRRIEVSFSKGHLLGS